MDLSLYIDPVSHYATFKNIAEEGKNIVYYVCYREP